MKASLIEFKNGISNLLDYIDILNSHSKVIKNTDTNLSNDFKNYVNKVKSFRKEKSRFEYNSIIITLYGYIEQCIESLVSDYVNTLIKIEGETSSLPDKILRNHTDLTIKKISKGKSYNNLNDPDIREMISNLNNCLQNKDPLSLNSAAFAYHTSNIRVSEIDRMFSKVGINTACRKAASTHQFKKFITENHPNRSLNSGHEEESLTEIDDLAERRNEVAHGLTHDILSIDLLLENISFVKAFGKALFQVISEECLPSVVNNHGIRLGKPINVYDNKIVCVNNRKNRIEENHGLVFENENTSHYTMSLIKNMQINKKM